MRAMMFTLLLTAVARSQDVPRPPDDAGEQVQRAPTDGFWPTHKMIEGLLLRWADRTATTFELDDKQRRTLERQLLKRWPDFLNANRTTLQPLFNEYIESRLGYTPPDPDSVKKWSTRALPLFEKLSEQMLETQRDMGEFLTPKQRAKLVRESLKVSAGLEMFRAKLKSWRRGTFDVNEWWDAPPGADRPHDTQAKRDPPDAAPDLVGDRVDEELLRWDYFVSDFVDKYKLLGAQRETAYSVLRECKGRARAFRDRNRVRMEELENEVSAAATLTEAQRDRIAAMYGPIDRVFADLKERLDAIPTTAQSAAANAPPPPPADPAATAP